MDKGLLGRDDERARLDAVLASARRGESSALLVTGEAGIGKSRLIQGAAEAAIDDDMTVLRVTGVQSEVDLSFAGLHRMLRPVLDRVRGLPKPQRDALGVVFGIEAGPAADVFLVSLAALTLLSDVGAGRPVVCLVDDVDWLDHETIVVLGFVARRLLADHVALVFTCRDTDRSPAALDGVSVMAVGPLDDESSRTLLASVVSTPLDHVTAVRIAAETRGNPLAIVELAEGLTASQLRGELDPLQPLPLSHRLEARYLDLVRRLSPDAQEVLLLAAAEPTGDASLVISAAAGMGVDPAALDEAVDAGLVATRPTIEFRHPILRAAVYGAAGGDRRRLAHRHLATAAADAGAAEMRAWHMGLGVVGADDTAAAELERSAAEVRSRSGYSTEASFLALAADVSSTPSDAIDRLLAAATAAAAAGAQARARALVERVRAEPHDDRQEANARWLDGLFLMHEGRYGSAPAVLMSSARRYAAIDRAQARLVMLDALGAACLAGDRAERVTPAEVARAALDMPRAADRADREATMADLLLDGLATRMAIGYREAVPLLRAALERWSPDAVPADNVTLWCTLGTYAALELFDLDALRDWVGAIEQHARDARATALLRVVLYGLATEACLLGRLDDAELLNDEARQLNRVTGAPEHLDALIDVELLAVAGRREEALAAAAVTEAIAAATGFDNADCRRLMASVRIDVAAGRYESALASGLAITARTAVGYGTLVLPDIVEAGVRSGDTRAATVAADELAGRAEASGTPWAWGLHDRCTALLTADDDAEAAYRSSIERLSVTAARLDLARSRLLYGEWLRRQGRRIDAREQLVAAATAFGEMGAHLFQDRARHELAATGGSQPRRRDRGATPALTPQERQVAELAAQRQTNREIAARLFVSPSTVDYHLRKVFQKLGVTSRRELPSALAGAD